LTGAGNFIVEISCFTSSGDFPSLSNNFGNPERPYLTIVGPNIVKIPSTPSPPSIPSGPPRAANDQVIAAAPTELEVAINIHRTTPGTPSDATTLKTLESKELDWLGGSELFSDMINTSFDSISYCSVVMTPIALRYIEKDFYTTSQY
jgi:hypothetical protein